eukprot:TRINITY_DN7904_c0_g1_i5.p3 TRINITY_DN7904_c0_g1~~TRINITY_DN7904_c0_g1_i5.p3  ORF type:complete len:175 (+),score=11.83 TRINITY_DN7904_c0_g1_i5:81-605(+)
MTFLILSFIFCFPFFLSFLFFFFSSYGCPLFLYFFTLFCNLNSGKQLIGKQLFYSNFFCGLWISRKVSQNVTECNNEESFILQLFLFVKLNSGKVFFQSNLFYGCPLILKSEAQKFSREFNNEKIFKFEVQKFSREFNNEKIFKFEFEFFLNSGKVPKIEFFFFFRPILSFFLC